VHEVKIDPASYSLQNRVFPQGSRRIPTHVRQAEIGFGGERHHPAWDEAESFRAATFITMLAQYLHPKANPENGSPAGGELANRTYETARPQTLHRRGKSSHAGQQEVSEVVEIRR
jgi:hypothetical protein